MTSVLGDVIVGVDTHADTHHAAVLDQHGRRLADRQFPATGSGYAALLRFIVSFGTIVRVGVEGTGSYGAGLSRHLRAAGVAVVEVIQPSRQQRRLRGKSDPEDAYAAAQVALTQSQHPVPKSADGPVEGIRYLLTARRSAVKARTAAQIQLKTLLVTAPEPLRQRFRDHSDKNLVAALAAQRPTTEEPIRISLRSIARRHQQLTTEITDLDTLLAELVAQVNPALAATKGIGTITAAQLLVTAGDNPDRLRSEASFAALAGASPIPASSGKTTRHRLNRGGDRQANAALHRIALVRMTYEPRTRAYTAKKRAQGHSSKEILRCLKRAIAREVFRLLTQHAEIPRVDDLRPLRKQRGLSLTAVANHFGVWPNVISTIERGTRRDDDFTCTYRQWLLTG